MARGYNPYGEAPVKPYQKALEPVHFQQDDHPALSRNLMRDLQARRAELLDGLIAAKDWPDFEKRRGLIHGIDNAITLCQKQAELLNS